MTIKLAYYWILNTFEMKNIALHRDIGWSKYITLDVVNIVKQMQN